MVTDTEAIVLRQVKTLGGRRMLLLFSKKYGKISVGTNMTEGGKGKSALALRPFTYGRYELFKSRENYNLNNGQVIKSYYGIGEDLDKYMAASYVLELTEKMLAEDLPQPRIFSLLLDFFDGLERRQRKHDTLVMAYIVKILDIMGTMPQTGSCSLCGGENSQRFFSVEEGGMLCPACAKALVEEHNNEPLIYDTDFGIVNILRYFQKEPFSTFEKLALDGEIIRKLRAILKSYMAYHLDIGKLKSEDFSFE
ncbi:MAG: DNA repair protein RecO [Firmicutes bacterium]|nr:DNA repair protein RecO [Bacillota bacterium]